MVIVTVVLLVIGGLLTAFLFPRNVSVEIKMLNTTNNWIVLRNDTCQAALDIEVLWVTLPSLVPRFSRLHSSLPSATLAY